MPGNLGARNGLPVGLRDMPLQLGLAEPQCLCAATVPDLESAEGFAAESGYDVIDLGGNPELDASPIPE